MDKDILVLTFCEDGIAADLSAVSGDDVVLAITFDLQSFKCIESLNDPGPDMIISFSDRAKAAQGCTDGIDEVADIMIDRIASTRPHDNVAFVDGAVKYQIKALPPSNTHCRSQDTTESKSGLSP